MIEVQISDLFQKHGKDFDWETRINEQEKFVSRIREANKDILNPNAIAIHQITEEISEFCTEHVASYDYREYIFNELDKLGVSLT